MVVRGKEGREAAIGRKNEINTGYCSRSGKCVGPPKRMCWSRLVTAFWKTAVVVTVDWGQMQH